VRAVTGLAKALGMVSVAEGVEREDQMARVGIEGCSEVQGFLISPPMPAREVLGFLGVGPRMVPSGEDAAGSARRETEWPTKLLVHVPASHVSV
jgi:predicted signal transduction protein with EAL and GGDEF domain